MNLTIILRNGDQRAWKNPKCVSVICHTPHNKDERCMDVQIDKELICDVNMVTMKYDTSESKIEYFNIFEVPYEHWTDEEVSKYLKQHKPDHVRVLVE